jgi:hypothetical protein
MVLKIVVAGMKKDNRRPTAKGERFEARSYNGLTAKNQIVIAGEELRRN